MQRITSSDSQFHDGDPSTGVLGTFLEAAWHNAVQEEIAGFIEGAGIVLDPTNNGQLVKAFAARMTRTAPLADVGTINAYAAVNIVPLTAQTLVHGVRQRITIGTTNSGASTYSPDGLPPKPILGMELIGLQGLELLATQVAELEYVVAASVNGGNGAWLLLRCAGGAVQIPAFSYGATPSQFNNSTAIPNTAFVQRSLGNYAATVSSSSTSYQIPATAMGQAIVAGSMTSAPTWTMPATTDVVSGAAVRISNLSGYALTLIPKNGTDKFIGAFNPSGSAASFVMAPWSEVTVAMYGGLWLTMGTADSYNSPLYSSSLAVSGYEVRPNGSIFQWGTVTYTNTSPGSIYTTGITFPLAFKQNVFAIFPSQQTNVPNQVQTSYGGTTLNGFNLYTYTSQAFGSLPVTWCALGK